MAKASKLAKFLKNHPLCCFCGGMVQATTIDHIPPKACFPRGLSPSTFEFPACAQCNNGTARDDAIFGYYSQLIDFNQSGRTSSDLERLRQLHNDLINRYPQAIPDFGSIKPLYKIGSLYSPSPVAYSVQFQSYIYQTVLHVALAKLTHALYYRETGKVLTPKHILTGITYQLQGRGAVLTDYLNMMLPVRRIATKENVHNYGNRFMYKFLYTADDDFFIYAVQFGLGLIMQGSTYGPDVRMPEDTLTNLPQVFAGQGPEFYRNIPFGVISS